MDEHKKISEWFFSQPWSIPLSIIGGALVAPLACLVALEILLKLLGVTA
jgi:hypothetical protein